MNRITLSNSPLLLPAVAMITGIVVCRAWGWMAAGCFVAAAGMVVVAAYAIWGRADGERGRQACTAAMACLGFVGLGALVFALHNPSGETATGNEPGREETAAPFEFHRKQTFVAHILTRPEKASPRSRYRSCTAELLSGLNAATGTQAPDTVRQETWVGTDRMILLMLDTTLDVQPAQIIVFQTKPRPLPEGGYGRHLANRGYVFRGYTYDFQPIGIDTTARLRLDLYRMKLGDRLSQVDTSGLTAALVLGEKSDLGRDLKREYRRTGASHVLAVSGLHVGIIFAILNVLLGGLKLLRHGRRYLAGVVIVALIGYAALTGFSVSVMRAVVMFSLLQIGVMAMRHTSSINTLSLACLVILLWWPNGLFDLGFQLSFLAMVSILTLYGPIISRWQPKAVVWRWLYSLTVLTITAQIGTLPLIAYTFGAVPLLSVVLSPLLWLTVPMIICFGALYLLTDAWLFGQLTAWSAWLQNAAIGRLSSLSFVQADSIAFPLSVCLLLYVVFFCGVLLLHTPWPMRRKIFDNFLRNKDRRNRSHTV